MDSKRFVWMVQVIEECPFGLEITGLFEHLGSAVAAAEERMRELNSGGRSASGEGWKAQPWGRGVMWELGDSGLLFVTIEFTEVKS